MKRYQTHQKVNYEKLRHLQRTREQRGGFRCVHCRGQVVINAYMGTANRNHCNMCLWSRHVDERKGDRLATCQAGMRPVGLTFRIEARDRLGEIMLIHACTGCRKTSINRIAADDLDHEILGVFARSFGMDSGLRQRILGAGVLPALKADATAVRTQLFGR